MDLLREIPDPINPLSETNNREFDKEGKGRKRTEV